MIDWRRRVEALVSGAGPLIYVQPIYRLADRLRIGVEALSRFPESRLPSELVELGLSDANALGFSPDVWFAQADLLGLGVDLEVAAIQSALQILSMLPSDHYIAVNVGPETLVSPRFHAAIAGVDLSQVVLEITEHLRIKDYGAIRVAVANLQANHAAHFCTKIPGVAADDVGAGEASLHHVIELAAVLDFCKLDISLTRNIQAERARQVFARVLVNAGHDLGFKIVAEGIETQDQLDVLTTLGIYAGQGYYLARPDAPEQVLSN